VAPRRIIQPDGLRSLISHDRPRAPGAIPKVVRARGRVTIDVATTLHQLLGYVVVMVVLTAGVVGLVQAREARAFVPRVYVIAAVALDVQVLGGLAIYTFGAYWGHESLLVRLVHPFFAALALVATHVGLKRSRRQETNVAGHRTAAGGLLLALLSMLIAIAAVSAGLRA
jgi:hypothetical protein